MRNIFEYSDPIISIFRKGSDDDPFVFYENVIFQVVKLHVLLNEVPSKEHRVIVKDLLTDELYYEVDDLDAVPREQEFRVDYTNGLITFHESAEGKNLLFDFYGRGLAFFPSSRIWTRENNGNVTETLQDIIVSAQSFKHLSEYSPTTKYDPFNMVSYQGGTYMATKETMGNVPTNTTYWRKISGFQWSIYSSAVTYDAGDIVNDVKKENIYISLIANNIGNPLTDTAKWRVLVSVEDIVNTVNATNTNVKNAETLRVTAESSRVTDEDTRKSNETTRQSQETGRVTAESSRVTDENTRKSNETTRISDEDARKANETDRISKEDIRVTSEDQRISDENIRKSNETTRQSQESTRQTNEQTRITTYNNFTDKGEYNNSTAYKKFNVVTFDGSSYMCIKDSTGNNPLDVMYWQIAAKKGDKGATLNPRGNYSAGTSYAINDLVTYGDGVYYCTQQSIGNLPTNTTYWSVFLIGGGDMRKDVYDINSNGIVDDAEKLGGKIPSYYEGLATTAETNAKNYADTKLANKVDKVTGKQLSTEDYTTAEKTKLTNVSTQANKTTVLTENSGKIEVDGVSKTVYAHPETHSPSIIAQDASNRFVTDAKMVAWDAKETPEGSQAKADWVKGYIEANWKQKHLVTADNGVCINVSNQSMNDQMLNGMYMGSNMLNAPDAGWWLFEVFSHIAGTYCVQVAYEMTSNSRSFIRRQENGNWYPWVEKATSDRWKQKHKLTEDSGTPTEITGKNANNYFTTGFFYGTNVTNAPDINSFYFFSVVGVESGTWARQKAQNWFTNQIFERRLNSGTWQPWVEIITSEGGTINGSIKSIHGYPFMSKVAGHKSYTLHNSGDGHLYISPSGSVDGEDWLFYKGMMLNADTGILSVNGNATWTTANLRTTNGYLEYWNGSAWVSSDGGVMIPSNNIKIDEPTQRAGQRNQQRLVAKFMPQTTGDVRVMFELQGASNVQARFTVARGGSAGIDWNMPIGASLTADENKMETLTSHQSPTWTPFTVTVSIESKIPHYFVITSNTSLTATVRDFKLAYDTI